MEEFDLTDAVGEHIEMRKRRENFKWRVRIFGWLIAILFIGFILLAISVIK